MYRQMAEEWARYMACRLISPSGVWMTHLRNYALVCGKIRHLRHPGRGDIARHRVAAATEEPGRPRPFGTASAPRPLLPARGRLGRGADGMPTRIRRVLFATTQVHFPQGGGGGERNAHELCLALRARGVEPAVLCGLSISSGSPWLIHANRLKRFVLHHRFPRDSVCGYPVFRGWDWSEAAAEELAARFGPQLAIVQMPHPEPLIRVLSRSGIPCAVYVHEVESINDLEPLGRQGVPFLANSHFTAVRLREQCGIEAHVIRPLVNPALYVTSTRRHRVLFINTVPRKGVEIALRLAESRPDILFDFVWYWTFTPDQLQALTARAAAAGNITLHPPTQDMRPLYAAARVVLVPSQWEEAWGRVVTEAHVNGIPVLASDRGGLPESVGPGGIMVPAEAPHAAWLAALAELWDNPEAYARYSAAAAAYARRPQIQPEVIVDKLHRLLPELACGGKVKWRPVGPTRSAASAGPSSCSATRPIEFATAAAQSRSRPTASALLPRPQPKMSDLQGPRPAE
jgi:glycosyltransferase involved in cell wall biosynthesis